MNWTRFWFVTIPVAMAVLIVAWILFVRWFDRERVNFEVRAIEGHPGVYCAFAIGSTNRSISCWKEDEDERRRRQVP